MSTLMDSYEKLHQEVTRLRREALYAEDRLLWWVLAMAVGAMVFGLLMFIAGSNCEATRQVMEGLN